MKFSSYMRGCVPNLKKTSDTILAPRYLIFGSNVTKDIIKMSPKKVRIKHLIPLLISFKKCMKFWYDKTYEKYDLLPFHILFIQTFRSFFQDRHILVSESTK